MILSFWIHRIIRMHVLKDERSKTSSVCNGAACLSKRYLSLWTHTIPMILCCCYVFSPLFLISLCLSLIHSQQSVWNTIYVKWYEPHEHTINRFTNELKTMRSSHSMRTEEETHTIYYFYSTVDVVVAVGFFSLSLSLGRFQQRKKPKCIGTMSI